LTTDQLLGLVGKMPFTAFTIRTADGREIAVNHPEAIAHTGGRIAAILHPNDQMEIVDLLIVSSILIGPIGANA
jgi:hypothetical protein